MDTRTALLDAGRELFARHGFDGATVRDITGRAGANLGAVTYHFGSKQALYAAVLEREITPLRRAVERVEAVEGQALEGILQILELYFGHLAKHPALPRLMLQQIAAGRLPPDAVLEAIRSISGILGRFQARGEAEGSVRPGHPLLTALSVVSQPIYMSLVLPLAEGAFGLDLTSPEARDRVVGHAADFVRRGLEPRPEVQP